MPRRWPVVWCECNETSNVPFKCSRADGRSADRASESNAFRTRRIVKTLYWQNHRRTSFHRPAGFLTCSTFLRTFGHVLIAGMLFTLRRAPGADFRARRTNLPGIGSAPRGQRGRGTANICAVQARAHIGGVGFVPLLDETGTVRGAHIARDLTRCTRRCTFLHCILLMMHC